MKFINKSFILSYQRRWHHESSNHRSFTIVLPTLYEIFIFCVDLFFRTDYFYIVDSVSYTHLDVYKRQVSKVEDLLYLILIWINKKEIIFYKTAIFLLLFLNQVKVNRSITNKITTYISFDEYFLINECE